MRCVCAQLFSWLQTPQCSRPWGGERVLKHVNQGSLLGRAYCACDHTILTRCMRPWQSLSWTCSHLYGQEHIHFPTVSPWASALESTTAQAHRAGVINWWPTGAAVAHCLPSSCATSLSLCRICHLRGQSGCLCTDWQQPSLEGVKGSTDAVSP